MQLVKEHLRDVPLYVAGGDEEILNDRTLKGKLLISSWNSFKGREADCIVLIQLDEKYFKYYERQWGSRPDVPKIMYVAATRALKQLVIVADARATLRTLDPKTIDADVVYVTDKRPALYRFRHPKEKDLHVGVLDLLRHVDTGTERLMLSLIERAGVEHVGAPASEAAPTASFHAPNLHANSGGATAHRYVEDVSAFYGIVIPRIAEYHLTDETCFGGTSCPRTSSTRTRRSSTPGT